MEGEKEVVEVNIEHEKEVKEVNMEGEKEGETKGNITSGKETWWKTFFSWETWASFKSERMQTKICCTLESMRGKTQLDPKRKDHVHDAPKQGYLTKNVRSFYVNLKDALSDSQEINVAMKS